VCFVLQGVQYFVWYQASNTVSMRSPLFWDATQSLSYHLPITGDNWLVPFSRSSSASGLLNPWVWDRLECLILNRGTDRFSRNVGDWLTDWLTDQSAMRKIQEELRFYSVVPKHAETNSVRIQVFLFVRLHRLLGVFRRFELSCQICLHVLWGAVWSECLRSHLWKIIQLHAYQICENFMFLLCIITCNIYNLEVCHPRCVFENWKRVCSQTQLCQLRCLMTIRDNYMLRPLLAFFRLSSRELKLVGT